MKRFKVFSLLSALFLAAPLMAEPAAGDAPPKASVDVTLEFASNYVWRGQDIYQDAFVQDGKTIGSTNRAGAFQPDILINTPVDGLYVDIWSSIAMSHRKNVDYDGYLQTTPGGSNLLFGAAANPQILDPLTGGINSTNLENLYRALPTDIPASGIDSYFSGKTNGTYRGGVPGFYKEDNGLGRFDETDLTVGYSKDTSIGTIGFGVITYQYVNSVGKAPGATTEMFVKYALPMLPQLSLAMYGNVVNSNQYYNLAYGDDFKLGKDVTLSYGVGAGYSVISRAQGIQDITGKVKLDVSGFFASFNVANRPNLKFFDTDGTNAALPLWLDGGSTTSDGLVADPSRNKGLLNAMVNYNIQDKLIPGNANYTYTPRQKLPRNLYWVSIGYSTSI